MHTVIPNFVDVERFHPATDAERIAARERFGLAPDAFVIGEVAAVKKHHKRVDRLIQAFAGYCRAEPDSGVSVRLAIAGAHTPETDAIRALTDSLAPGRVVFFFDLTPDDMPMFYQALDLFVHAALFEMMPIAILEAMASGLPVAHHDHPVMNWMVDQGGVAFDFNRSDQISEALGTLAGNATRRANMGATARERSVTMFSKAIVIPRIVSYYREVRNSPPGYGDPV